MSSFQYNDGGRRAAGFTGNAGDCVCRAVAIAAQMPYADIYAALANGNAGQRRTKHSKRQSGRRTARNGIFTGRQWFKAYMAALGFTWVPTMAIGSGCKVHLDARELPAGRLVVSVSRHYVAVIDGVINDTADPSRSESFSIEPDLGQDLKPWQWRNVNGIVTRIGGRCVYGYWIKGGTR